MAAVKIVGQVAVKVKPDTKSFKSDLRQQLERIEKSIGTIDIKVKPKVNESDKDRIKREMDNLKKDIEDKAIKLQTELNNGDVAKVAALLGALAKKRTVLFKAEIDKTAYAQVGTALAALSGGRVVSNYIENMVTALSNLDKSVPALAATATGVTTLGVAALSATTHTLSLAGGLATMGKAALPLPGIVGGFAVGLGVTIAALKDFNDQLPEVAGKIHDLQDSLSANFWDQAREPMRDFINNIWPDFSSGVNDAATEIGKFFGTFSTELDKALRKDDALSNMFENLSASIEIATAHTDSFATIIARLGSIGARWLPELAGWFGDISEEFAGWLTQTSDKQFDQWIQQGVDAVQNFGLVIANVSGILRNLSQAASEAGGIGLQGLADKMQHVNEKTAEGTPFFENLTKVLEAARLAMDDITNTAGPAFSGFMDNLSDTFTKVAPIIGDTIGPALEAIFEALDQPEVHAGIIEFFEGVKTAVEKLAPAMDPLADALATLMPLAGDVAALIGDVLSDAISGLAPIVETVAPVLEDLVEKLDPISPLIAGVAAAFATVSVASFVGAMATAAFATISSATTIIAWTARMVASVVAGFVSMSLAVAGFILRLALYTLAFIAATIIVGIQMAIQVAAVIAGWVAMAAAAMANAIVMAVAWLIALGPIGLVIAAILAVIAVVVLCILYWDEIKAATAAAWDWIAAKLAAVWNWITTKAGQVWEWLKAKIGAGWDWLKTKTLAIWDSITAWIGKKWDQIREKCSNAVESVKTNLADKWEQIKQTVSDKWEAMKQKISDKLEAIKASVSAKIDSIKTTMGAKWDSIKETIAAKWEAMKTKVGEKIDAMIELVKAIPGKVTGALGDLGNLLVNAGRQIIQGLIDGIQDMIKPLTDKLGAVTNLIPDFKGPETVDKVLLTPAGRMIMDGLIAGIDDRAGALKDALQDVTRSIESEFSAGSDYRVGVATTLDTNGSDLSAISGLSRTVGANTRVLAADENGNVSIGNITIPLEDLEQLKTLEDFLDMLRVRTRQGVIN